MASDLRLRHVVSVFGHLDSMLEANALRPLYEYTPSRGLGLALWGDGWE